MNECIVNSRALTYETLRDAQSPLPISPMNQLTGKSQFAINKINRRRKFEFTVPESIARARNKDPICDITGDDAFPLKNYLMKPYPLKNLTLEKRIFNYRLSRKRRISENGFGIFGKQMACFPKAHSIESCKSENYHGYSPYFTQLAEK